MIMTKSEKWFWMMNYCERKGLPPAQNWGWKIAEDVFEVKFNKKGEIKMEGEYVYFEKTITFHWVCPGCNETNTETKFPHTVECKNCGRFYKGYMG